MWCFFVIFILLVVLAEWWRQTKDSCGIPVVLYAEIFFILITISYLAQIIMTCCCRITLRTVVCATVMVVLWILVYIGLIIWGFVIWTSDKNDCAEYVDTRGWNTFMLILLILGAFFLAIIFCLACCLCCVLCNGEDANENTYIATAKGLAGLNVAKDDEDVKRVEECVICMDKFADDDRELVQLKCNKGHIFHKECIEKNIAAGSVDCPLCKAPIVSDDIDMDAMQAMMEEKKEDDMMGE